MPTLPLAPLHAPRVSLSPSTLALALTLMLSLMLALLSCDTPKSEGHVGGAELAGAEPMAGVTVGGFDDHTHARAPTLEAFEALSVEDGESGSILKFYLSGFVEGEQLTVRLLDGGFYTLHDEVFWMRLLNGLKAWGIDWINPISGLSLPDVRAAYLWAEELRERGEPLPLGLRFTSGGRLYSSEFYQIALGRPRHIALGTILHIPPREGRRRPEELWAFELEYSDEPSPEEVHWMGVQLRAALPPEAEGLLWLTRSPQQEAVAQRMEDERLPSWERVLRYPELSTPGEARVYSEGLSAGRLYVRRAAEEAEPPPSRSILLLDHVPDDLPATQGLITTVPQTPLAHINLLAQNRGIPNVYVAELIDSPLISQLEPIRAGVILWAEAPDHWRLEPLSNEELARYHELVTPSLRSLPRVELSSQPLSYALDELSLGQSLSLRGVIGGKAAGLVACLESGGERARSESPYQALVITGRAYEEHLSPWREKLSELLNHPSFALDGGLRLIALEGPLGLARSSAAERARVQGLIEQLRAERGDDDAILWWVDRAGVQGLIRSTPLPQPLLTSLLELLRERFEALSPQQGLRFRSSSNVEDLEGFNGAGLYSSKTGYLYPQALEGARRSQSVAWALKEVWASYWGLEAFRERAAEGITHLDGHMSALVHPNFQDEAERSNGVIITTLSPPPPSQLSSEPMRPAQALATIHINAQAGALSVTNPERPGALPELIVVEVWPTDSAPPELSWPYEGLAQPLEPLLEHLELRVDRRQASTEQAEVLSDEELRVISLRSLEASARWLTELRRSSSPAQAPLSLSLDLEFRAVEPWWPLSRRSQEEVGAGSARVILKQARPLEPASEGLPESLYELEAPRDLVRRARLIERVHCEVEQPHSPDEPPAMVSLTQLYTQPLLKPSLGYETRPFTAELSLEGWRPQREGAGELTGAPWRATHSAFGLRAAQEGAPWSIELSPRVEAGSEGPCPLAHLALYASDDRLSSVEARWLERGSTEPLSAPAHCERALLFAGPSEYLRQLLESRPAPP